MLPKATQSLRNQPNGSALQIRAAILLILFFYTQIGLSQFINDVASIHGGETGTRILVPENLKAITRYNDPAGKPYVTTESDPAEQKQLADQNYTYLWRLGYLFEATQAQPANTVEACIYKHFSKGTITTTACSGSGRTALESKGFNFLKKIGYLYNANYTPQNYLTVFCRYENAAGENYSTTLCSGSLRDTLELKYGWSYKEKLGYVFRGDIVPPVKSTNALSHKKIKIVDLHISSESDRTLYIQRYSYPSEIAPMVLDLGNGKRTYVMSTAWSLKFESSDNYLFKKIVPQDLNLITKPEILKTFDLSTGSASYQNPPPPGLAWNRCYNGLLSLHKVGSGASAKIIGFTHGENSNSISGGVKIYNTIKDPVDSNCFSGYINGVYEHCWSQFSAFTSLKWWNIQDFIDGKPPVDEGPVIWPSVTYAKNTAGMYHPTSFVANDTIYLYFQDQKRVSGGWPLLSGVKAPLKSSALPDTFKVYKGSGVYSKSVNSLPQGFDKDNLKPFLNMAGNESKEFFSRLYPQSYLNVAKIKDTKYFISAEERILREAGQQTKSQIVIRLSDDPGDWSQSSEYILESIEGSWGDVKFTYPTFVNASATTNYEVEKEDFYITGNHPKGGYKLSARRLSIDFNDNTPPTVTCTKTIEAIPEAGCTYTIPDLLKTVKISDNIYERFTLSQEPKAGTLIRNNTPVTIKAIDGNGNSSTCKVDILFPTAVFSRDNNTCKRR